MLLVPLLWITASIVGGQVFAWSMEDIEAVAAQATVDDVLQQDFDREFDGIVSTWTAEQGEYSEARDCLATLLESRAVMAAMQAQEQRCLARLEAIALESAALRPGASTAGGSAREIAWRSMVAEIAVATRLADRTVQAMMGRATELVTTLPAVLDALESGRISIGHARVILEHATGIEGAAREDYERITVARAEATTPGKLAATAKIAAARLRAGTFEDRHAEARENRRVSIRDLDDGMSELTHFLPTPYAAAIFDRLTRQAKAVVATGDPRSRDQLRSDIATDLLLTGEPASGDSASGQKAPHTAADGIRAEIAIVIPALTLLGLGDEPATLAGRGPIDLHTACRLASKAPELLRILTDPVSDLIITADSYRPSASLRRYLEARDRHCQFPSCNQDARYCDLDHTIPWQDGGKTVPGNLAALCRGHHTIKHHGRWKVKQVSPGVLEWTSPLGNVVTNPSPPGPRFRAVPGTGNSDETPPPF